MVVSVLLNSYYSMLPCSVYDVMSPSRCTVCKSVGTMKRLEEKAN